MKLVRVVVQHLAVQIEEADMRDWKSAFQQEDRRTTRSRQQLKRERVRLLLKSWDGIVNDLLRGIARETWREDMSRVTFSRSVAQSDNSSGILAFTGRPA